MLEGGDQIYKFRAVKRIHSDICIVMVTDTSNIAYHIRIYVLKKSGIFPKYYELSGSSMKEIFLPNERFTQGTLNIKTKSGLFWRQIRDF